MRSNICVVLLAVWVGPALAEAPFSFDTAPGRLPKDVVPQAYDIALVPDIAKHTVRGNETIVLKVRSASATISFNSLYETLDHVLFDGRPVQKVESDDQAQLTKLTLAKAATPGLHRLTFSYRVGSSRSPSGCTPKRLRARTAPLHPCCRRNSSPPMPDACSRAGMSPPSAPPFG